MRPATACHACRVGKRKCRPNKERRKAPCARCQKLKIPCSLGAIPGQQSGLSSSKSDASTSGYRPRSGSNMSASDDLASPASSSHFDLPWMQEMVDNYFDVVHDKNHSLFHRPSFDRDLRCNRLPDVVLYAVLSLGSRLSPVGKRKSDYLAERAFQLCNLRDASITTIQACVLLGTICIVNGNAQPEALYYTTALRLGLILDLPGRHCETELERQVNLRVWWTLYMIDVWSSAGLRLPRQLRFDASIELPLEESRFLGLSASDTCWPVTSKPTGIWGHMAKLTRLWAEIQDVNMAAVDTYVSPMALASEIDTLSDKLAKWKSELPSFLEESKENLVRAAAIGQGTSFAALHLGFHYYHEVLFFPFMAESHQNASSLAKSYADRCDMHARGFCDLLYMCEETANCRCLYSMVGHMVVVTSTVYMHRLLFNGGSADEQDAGRIRKRLEHNFEILTELQTHWESLDTFMSRLKVFHNACLYSIEHSFNMDRWMRRFIFQHGTAMPEKFADMTDGTARMPLWRDNDDAGGEGPSLQALYSRDLA